MTAPRPGKPDICFLCGAKLALRKGYYWHDIAGCILTDWSFRNTPENVTLWNRRLGKPLWAPPHVPERPWEDPDYLATHPRKE